MNVEALREYILRLKAKRGTWRNLAKDLGVSVSQLHTIANGKSEPEPKVLKALGFTAVVDYRKVK